MSQQQNTRTPFPSLVRDPNLRARPTQSKASGDTCNSKHRNRSKSKNKIPKSVRYDLENALVSLCDVWFEEIKPYLVRNNIKVHVHGATSDDEAGDRKRLSLDDHQRLLSSNCERLTLGDRKHLPPGPPQCFHLDPASSASECELCRLLFNAANSIESAVSQAACATATINGSEVLPFNSGTIPLSPCRNCLEMSEPKPRRRRRCGRVNGSPPLPPPKMLITNVIKPKMEDKYVQTDTILKTAPKRKPWIKPSIKKSAHYCATTTLIPEVDKKVTNELEINQISPLFKKDLIDILVEKIDKKLHVLYESPKRDEALSKMNLLPSPKVKQKNYPKRKPWK